MGFNSQVLGPYAGAPQFVYADNVAAFNQISQFLVHCDLVNDGIFLNNTASQIIGNVQINVNPGSQITFAPFNAPRSSISNLVGSTKSVIRVWLTDQNNVPVNTNSDYFSLRITIRYNLPVFIDRN